MKRQAFTLIELLVAISIIVTLLALLLPALDKATYEARLAACGARIRAHIAAAQNYSFDNRKFYPRRTVITNGYTPWANCLKGKVVTTQVWRDDRPRIKPYISAEMHKDPLAESEINVYEDDDELTSMVWSTYGLYYGWRFGNNETGGKGATRFGRPFEWMNQKYFVLVSDWDNRAPPQSFASHPDRREVLALRELLNNETEVTNTPGATQATGYVLTGTYWYRRQAPAPRGRGYIDTNHGMQDNSVQLARDVPFDVNPIYRYNGAGIQTGRGLNYRGPVVRIGNASNANRNLFDGGAHVQVIRR